MRELTATLVVCSLLLVSACGRVQEKSLSGLSEQAALDVLGRTPRDFTSKEVVSMEGFENVVQDLVASGKADLSADARGAISSSGGGLSQLGTLLNLLAQNQGVGSVANGVVNANGGSPTKAEAAMSKILNIMQALLPLIAIFAPAFVPIAQAVMAIVPSIISIIASFKKPTASLVPSYGLRPFWV